MALQRKKCSHLWINNALLKFYNNFGSSIYLSTKEFYQMDIQKRLVLFSYFTLA